MRTVHQNQSGATRRGFLKAAATLGGSFELGAGIARADDIPVSGVRVPRAASLDDWMQAFMKRMQVPGAALAISNRGQLVYARGFGLADTATGARVQPDSLFRVASISKAFTAVGVMQFVERKQLSLDSRLTEILNLSGATDDRWKQIAVKHLLQHTGGWDQNKFDPMFGSRTIAKTLGVKLPLSAGDVVQFMLSRPLDFDPGQKFAYSNFGFFMLGRAIERLSPVNYENYIREHVFAPCGVTRARLGKTRAAEAAVGEVSYYDTTTGPSALEADKIVPAPYGMWPLELMDANGGWICSAIDLVRFACAFDDPNHSPILGSAALAEIHRAPPGAAGLVEGGNFPGMGWFIWPQHSLPHRALASTNGLLAGISSYLMRRHDGINWAVLFNKARGGDDVPLIVSFRNESSEVLNGIEWSVPAGSAVPLKN